MSIKYIQITYFSFDKATIFYTFNSKIYILTHYLKQNTITIVFLIYQKHIIKQIQNMIGVNNGKSNTS